MHLHLLADDCAVFRTLDDPLAMPAFVAVVIQRLMLDFRARRWGKWRPSVAARRAGDVAIRLETLVVRDRIDFAEAYEILRRNHHVTESRDELYALLQSFPARHGLSSQRAVTLEDVAMASADEPPDAALGEEARARSERVLERCLTTQLGHLEAEDRLVLRMVYLEGRTVATVARALQLDQKGLYRRVERIHGSLRKALESAGVDSDGFRELMESRPGLQHLDLAGILGRYPSTPPTAGEDPPAWPPP